MRYITGLMAVNAAINSLLLVFGVGEDQFALELSSSELKVSDE